MGLLQTNKQKPFFSSKRFMIVVVWRGKLLVLQYDSYKQKIRFMNVIGEETVTSFAQNFEFSNQ